MGGGCIAHSVNCTLQSVHTVTQLYRHKADLKSLGAERLLALRTVEGQGQDVVEDLLGAQ